MKAMFASDFFVAKKYLIQQLIMCLVVGVFIALVMENIYVIPPAVGCMVPFGVAFTVLALDERENWEQFRLALPLSRTDVIAGRYLCLASVVIISIIAGLAIMGLAAAAATLFPDVPLLANLLVNFSWQAVVMVCTLAVVMMLIMIAGVLPAVARFGMTKAIRFAPLVLFMGVMLILTFGENITLPPFLLDFLTWIETPEGTIIAAALAIGVSVALYLASAALAIKLYEKREL